MLRFNALLLEKGNIRVEALEVSELSYEDEKNAFWHEDETVRKYLPEFKFTTWRDLHAKYRIEVFGIDIDAMIERAEIVQNKTVVLFEYGKENRWQKLLREDFWQGVQDGIS